MYARSLRCQELALLDVLTEYSRRIRKLRRQGIGERPVLGILGKAVEPVDQFERN